jgi:hypothetical protein
VTLSWILRLAGEPRHADGSDDPEHDTWHDCLIWAHTT